jgi:hypothetical protein
MDLAKRVSPGATDDDGVAFFGPFEHGSWSYAEFAADRRRNGDLTLSGDLGPRQRHETHITTVMDRLYSSVIELDSVSRERLNAAL